MINDDDNNINENDDDSLGTYAESESFHDLCEGISKLHNRIAGALIIRNGKILGTSVGAGSPIPTHEYLSKLIMQAQIVVGLSLGNKPAFGDLNYVLVSHERLENILIYLETQRAILGIGILPPYHKDALLAEIQKFLKKTHLQGKASTIV